MDDALASEIFRPNREWLRYIFQEAGTIRFSRPYFMTGLIDGPGRPSALFFEIFRRLGTPFYSNVFFEGGFVPPAGRSFGDVQAYQLLVFQEILRVFDGSTACDLYQFCKNRSDKDITNTLCKTAPWLRGVSDDLCPFGQLWKTWGLNGEVPVPGNGDGGIERS